jgi:hypothetical protein
LKKNRSYLKKKLTPTKSAPDVFALPGNLERDIGNIELIIPDALASIKEPGPFGPGSSVIESQGYAALLG